MCLELEDDTAEHDSSGMSGEELGLDELFGWVGWY